MRIRRRARPRREAGRVGEIYLRGRHLGPEFHLQQRRAKTPGEIAWTTSCTVGDVGYQDADGYVFLCDRKHDM